MRVLMLHNDYAQTGGEYFSVREEVASLTQRNVAVHFSTISNAAIEQDGRVEFVREVFTGKKSRELVAAAIDEFQPNIVHCQNLFPLMGGPVIRLLKERELPWVRTLRNYRVRCLSANCYRDGKECKQCSSAAQAFPGVLHGCYRGSRAASAVSLAYARREARAVKLHPPAATVILSEAMRPLLGVAVQTQHIVVKPNSTASSGLTTPIRRGDRRAEFVFVGRFSPEKGIDAVVRSFADRPNLRLTLIGEGHLPEETRSLIESSVNISVTGALPHGEAVSRMASALAVLVPSGWSEPFGRVAAEALSVGTPAIVSANGGLPEIMSPIGEMLVVKGADSWTDAAEALASYSTGDYDALAKECLRRWQGVYAETTVGSQLVRIYSDVLTRMER